MAKKKCQRLIKDDSIFIPVFWQTNKSRHGLVQSLVNIKVHLKKTNIQFKILICLCTKTQSVTLDFLSCREEKSVVNEMSEMELGENLIYNAIHASWSLLNTNVTTLTDWCWFGGGRDV